MKRWIFDKLGITDMLKAAFMEGWTMSREVTYHQTKIQRFEMPVWRSVEEAWANSDAEDL